LKKKKLPITTLWDYLALPLQRIPKYAKYFEKLLAGTPSNHVDYAGLEQATKTMKTIADYSLDKKMESDHAVYMFHLQSKIKIEVCNLSVLYL
jgi:hypothetical protein